MFCCTVWEYSENGKKSNFCLLKVAIVGGTLKFASPKQNVGGRVPRPPIAAHGPYHILLQKYDASFGAHCENLKNKPTLSVAKM